MTFDLDMWSLTTSTNADSHVASMTQLWLKSIKACGSKSQMLKGVAKIFLVKKTHESFAEANPHKIAEIMKKRVVLAHFIL